MRMKSFITSASLAVSMLLGYSVSAYANHCHYWVAPELWGITIHNDTNQRLHIDLGTPTHGWVDTLRDVYIPPHDTKRTGACSRNVFTGVQTYVRLRDQGGYYRAAWYVDQPLSGQNRIRYDRYNDVGTCTARYATGKAKSSFTASPFIHHVSGQWHVEKKMSSLRPEPNNIYTHDNIVEVDITCH